jgi:hypothetical protein
MTDNLERFLLHFVPREKLQDAQYAYDKLSEEMDEYSDEGLTQQVQDTYPDLLEKK